MKVKRFKLIDEGVGGIEASGIEIKDKGGSQIQAEVTIRFKIPLPMEINSKLQRLRTYFLSIYGLWGSDMDNYMKAGVLLDYDKEWDLNYYREANSLLNKVVITGLIRNEGKYCITAKWRMITDQVIGLATPQLEFKTGYGDFMKLQRGCDELLKDVSEYITSHKLSIMGAKKYLMALYKDDEAKLKELEGLSEFKLRKMQAEYLESHGAIVMLQDDYSDQDPVPEDERGVKTNEDTDGDSGDPPTENAADAVKNELPATVDPRKPAKKKKDA